MRMTIGAETVLVATSINHPYRRPQIPGLLEIELTWISSDIFER
jgi:hypothetical protein